MSEQTSSPAPRGFAQPVGPTYTSPSSLADVLERVLDKGIIIAGDIRVNLLDIELLTVKIRLLVVSVDKAMEMGIDWWRPRRRERADPGQRPDADLQRAGPCRREPSPA